MEYPTRLIGRWPALAIIVALWAAIYLPGLGSTEIKGEEGRRILPAVAMLETGEWIVPHIGGEPYLRKPPLINWLIAGSFHLSGERSELAARLPSVLSVLLLVATMSWMGAGWLGQERALLAAIFTLTNIGLIEKGRLIEIEALYIAFTGLAIFSWMSWWAEGRSRWRIWIIPFVWLGLGLLTKGPLHLLFFYAVVWCVLWRAGELRKLVAPAHFAGLAVMFGIFALWWVPYSHRPETAEAGKVWADQFAGRVGGLFDLGGWLSNIPRGLTNFLPWVLFLPFCAKELEAEPRMSALFRGTRLATLACFLGLLILPGVLPRYTLPLMVPGSVVLALALGELRGHRALRWWRTGNLVLAGLVAILAALAAVIGFPGRSVVGVAVLAMIAAAGVALWRARAAWKAPVQLGVITGMVAGMGLGLYAVVAVPKIREAADIRPMGAEIDAAVPAGEVLYAIDPGFQPAFFYVRSRVQYVDDVDRVPAGATRVLVRKKTLGKAQQHWPGAQVVAKIADQNKNQLFILNPGVESRISGLR